MRVKNKHHRKNFQKSIITKTFEGKQVRELGKTGKILTTDYVGMPCYGKIVKLEGVHPETPPIYEIVPIYQSCNKCGSYLGHLEIVNSKELNNMCTDCFQIEIGESLYFSQIGKFHSSCTDCGLYIEKENELFSKLDRICNHCYLRRTNLDENHSCIHCDPTFPIPTKLEEF